MSDATLVEPVDIPPSIAQPSIDWRAIIAGAITAAGVSFTLLAFGSAIGLSVVSTAPTWRDSSPWLWMISGLFLLFVALCSFGVGGYVAGRMQNRIRLATEADFAFRDGMHGLVTWGLAILLAAFTTIGTVATATHGGQSGGAGFSISPTGGDLLAPELDQLFMGEHDPAIYYHRTEASRVLLKGGSHDGISSQDRSTLAAIVSTSTGMAIPQATARVTTAIDQSTLALHHARQAAVMQAFLVAAALIAGAAISWYTAIEGGRDRERVIIPTARPRA
jgi:hypothetical protein